MPVSVFVHEKRSLSLVQYSGRVVVEDLETFSAFFRDPEIFPLINQGIAIIDDEALFGDLRFADVMKQAKTLEKITQDHERNGETLPDVVPIVIATRLHRIMARVWMAATDLAPKMRPRYQVCRTYEEALACVGLSDIPVDDVRTKKGFHKLDPPEHMARIA